MLKKQYYLNEQKEENLIDLVLISSIVVENSFEAFFRSSFSFEQVVLEDQAFLKRFKGMPKVLLIQNIENNLKGGKNQVQPPPIKQEE